MTDKQIIIDENEINPNDWLEPYKPIPACEIKDCEHWVYAGNNVYGCRIAEDGLVCDDFNNDDECCMYRQLEYYKEALKAKKQECEELKAKCKKYGLINEQETKDYAELKAERDNYIDKYFLESQKVVNLRKVLTEIKEIAEENKETAQYKGICFSILQKISEVEEC